MGQFEPQCIRYRTCVGTNTDKEGTKLNSDMDYTITLTLETINRNSMYFGLKIYNYSLSFQ